MSMATKIMTIELQMQRAIITLVFVNPVSSMIVMPKYYENRARVLETTLPFGPNQEAESFVVQLIAKGIEMETKIIPRVSKFA